MIVIYSYVRVFVYIMRSEGVTILNNAPSIAFLASYRCFRARQIVHSYFFYANGITSVRFTRYPPLVLVCATASKGIASRVSIFIIPCASSKKKKKRERERKKKKHAHVCVRTRRAKTKLINCAKCDLALRLREKGAKSEISFR